MNIENKTKTKHLERKEEKYKSFELLYKVLFDSRKVFRYVTDKEYDSHIYGLLFLLGISNAISNAETEGLVEQLDFPLALSMLILFGGLLGWITLYIYSSLLAWTGKWLKGTADRKQILRVLSYASIPSILTLLLVIPKVALYGKEMFIVEVDWSEDQFKLISYYFFVWAEMILAIFSLVLCIIAISEVQGFNIWKSIANMILAGFVVVVPIIFLGYLIAVLN